MHKKYFPRRLANLARDFYLFVSFQIKHKTPCGRVTNQEVKNKTKKNNNKNKSRKYKLRHVKMYMSLKIIFSCTKFASESAEPIGKTGLEAKQTLMNAPMRD